jgi:hypothetical protein
MTAALKVLVVAEGASEIGDLDALAFTGRRRGARPREGYFPPMLRKLLGLDVRIEAQKVTSLGRYEARRRLDGHGDRAAKALRLAETQGYVMLVFVKDVDREPGVKKSEAERRKKLREMREQIEAGFSEVRDADRVVRVKATPCRMLEAWALGDPDAIARVAGRRAKRDEVPKYPERLWGAQDDPSSNHPKCVLRRALGKEADARVFEDLALEGSEETLRASCPDSFAPFADEVAAAAKLLGDDHVRVSD